MENDKKDLMREAKEYASISTRLPKLDALRFILHCKRLGTNSSERIRDLVLRDMKEPIRQFLAGKNHLKYDRLTNSFSWLVQLDSGKEVKILDSLPMEFLKDLDSSIKEAINERNAWVHNTKGEGSVDIPAELVKGDKE